MSAAVVAGLVGGLVACAISGAALWAYHRTVVRPALQPRLGVVDIAEVYRQKEAEFTLILTRASSDAERDGAMRMARVFAQRLPMALEELSRECGCPVFVRTALAASSAHTAYTVDLTGQLRRKVDAP